MVRSRRNADESWLTSQDRADLERVVVVVAVGNLNSDVLDGNKKASGLDYFPAQN